MVMAVVMDEGSEVTNDMKEGMAAAVSVVGD